jgi:hypothetical protein
MPDTAANRSLTEAESQVLGESLYCEDELSLSWALALDLPAPEVLNRQNHRNENVLRALTMLEEHDESQAEDAERADLYRLEGKLNLVLELVAELVRERAGGAEPVQMRFNAAGLCWSTDETFPKDTLLVTQWYLLPSWPVALQLYARVRSCRAAGDLNLVCAELEGVSTGVAEWLEKLVFRRHRRMVALQRTYRHTGAATPGAEGEQ